MPITPNAHVSHYDYDGPPTIYRPTSLLEPAMGATPDLSGPKSNWCVPHALPSSTAAVWHPAPRWPAMRLSLLLLRHCPRPTAPRMPRLRRVLGDPLSAEEVRKLDEDDLARVRWKRKLREEEAANKEAAKKSTISLLAPDAAAAADAKANANFKAYDKHLNARLKVELATVNDLSNYFHHGSRASIGPNFQIQLDSKEECISTCDAMGAVCAGFMCASPPPERLSCEPPSTPPPQISPDTA